MIQITRPEREAVERMLAAGATHREIRRVLGTTRGTLDRYWPGTGRKPLPASTRFWAKVDKTDTCWLWAASTMKNGYGKFYPTNGSQYLAHRWAYEEQHGPIPDGLQIDHLCRVRNCVNPAHLEAVSPRVNQMRSEGLASLNARKTHCIRGHEFNAQNTSHLRGGTRQCKKCHAESMRRTRAARRKGSPS